MTYSMEPHELDIHLNDLSGRELRTQSSAGGPLRPALRPCTKGATL